MESYPTQWRENDRFVYRSCQVTDALGSWYLCEILDVMSWDLELLYNPERCALSYDDACSADMLCVVFNPSFVFSMRLVLTTFFSNNAGSQRREGFLRQARSMPWPRQVATQGMATSALSTGSSPSCFHSCIFKVWSSCTLSREPR